MICSVFGFVKKNNGRQLCANYLKKEDEWMQIAAMTIVLLLLVAGGFANGILGQLGIRKMHAVVFFLLLCVFELFPWEIQIGAIYVRPLTLVLEICLILRLFSHTPKGWERYRCVLCVCIVGVFTYFCALHFMEYTDRIVREYTASTALVTTAFAYILCRDTCGVLCAAVLNAGVCNTALSIAHRTLFSDPLYLGYAPVSLCVVYSMVYLLILFYLCSIVQRFVERRKRVHS